MNPVATEAVTGVGAGAGTGVDAGVGAGQQPAGPVVEEVTPRRNWWWRNVWGLLALVPLLAAIGWIHFDNVNERYWESQPREPVGAGVDGWVSFAGARVRLAGLEPATDLKTFSGQPFAPPPAVAAWRAILVFEAPDQETIGGCELLLEDAAGNTYAANPRELNGARGVVFATCTSDDKPPPPSYESVVYFATPTSARASAVRITLTTQLPRYARLTTSG